MGCNRSRSSHLAIVRVETPNISATWFRESNEESESVLMGGTIRRLRQPATPAGEIIKEQKLLRDLPAVSLGIFHAEWFEADAIRSSACYPGTKLLDQLCPLFHEFVPSCYFNVHFRKAIVPKEITDLLI